jgi:autotransporter passenger strand-loop-strand repeat protein
VFAGGSDIGTHISGGQELVDGIASGTTISQGGEQFVGYSFGNGTANNTTIAGGVQYVGFDAGSGTTTNTTIEAGGTQFVGYGFVTFRFAFLVGSGAAVSTTIESGGEQVVGGDYASGTAIDTTIESGGTQIVGDGFGSGTATNTTIEGGGIELINSGSIASGTTIFAGGAEYVQSGGLAQNVTFAGTSATLYLQSPSGVSGTISGWQTGDTIDFVSTSVVSAVISGSTLEVTVSGGSTYDYQLAGQEANTSASIQSDGNGGTDVVLVVDGPPTVSNGQTLEIFSGQTSNGINVLSGDLLKVDSGGSAVDTTVNSGGSETVSGSDFGAQISGGGEQDVFGVAVVPTCSVSSTAMALASAARR